MGKVEDNKRRKKDAITNSAFTLFIQNGIHDTSISDIMKKAELAKGTFYLYFKDKFEVRDYLIRKKAAHIFETTQVALEKAEIKEFEEKIVFLVDNILDQLEHNPVLLKFISKNLSWGIFKEAVMSLPAGNALNVENFMEQLFAEADRQFRNPELLMYMIIELVNSTAHNVILYNQPVGLPELKESLYPLIRQMICSFEA